MYSLILKVKDTMAENILIPKTAVSIKYIRHMENLLVDRENMKIESGSRVGTLNCTLVTMSDQQYCVEKRLYREY